MKMVEKYRHLLNEKEHTNLLLWGSKERELIALSKILAGKQLEIEYKWTWNLRSQYIVAKKRYKSFENVCKKE